MQLSNNLHSLPLTVLRLLVVPFLSASTFEAIKIKLKTFRPFEMTAVGVA